MAAAKKSGMVSVIVEDMPETGGEGGAVETTASPVRPGSRAMVPVSALSPEGPGA